MDVNEATKWAARHKRVTPRLLVRKSTVAISNGLCQPSIRRDTCCVSAWHPSLITLRGEGTGEELLAEWAQRRRLGIRRGYVQRWACRCLLQRS